MGCAHSPGTDIAFGSAPRGRAALLIPAALPDATVLTVLASCAAAGKLAEEHTRLGAAVSAPLVAMGTAMVLAAAAALPAASGAYDAVWDQLMPLAVALSLLGAPVDRAALRKGGAVLVAFAVGALGTVAGTFAAYALVGGALGPHAWKVAACLCASYVGGSLNYAATARALGLAATPGGQAALAAGMAADNLAMAAFLAALASSRRRNQAENPARARSPGPPTAENEPPANPTVSSLRARSRARWSCWRSGASPPPRRVPRGAHGGGRRRRRRALRLGGGGGGGTGRGGFWKAGASRGRRSRARAAWARC